MGKVNKCWKSSYNEVSLKFTNAYEFGSNVEEKVVKKASSAKSVTYFEEPDDSELLMILLHYRKKGSNHRRTLDFVFREKVKMSAENDFDLWVKQ